MCSFHTPPLSSPEGALPCVCYLRWCILLIVVTLWVGIGSRFGAWIGAAVDGSVQARDNGPVLSGMVLRPEINARCMRCAYINATASASQSKRCPLGSSPSCVPGCTVDGDDWCDTVSEMAHARCALEAPFRPADLGNLLRDHPNAHVSNEVRTPDTT